MVVLKGICLKQVQFGSLYLNVSLRVRLPKSLMYRTLQNFSSSATTLFWPLISTNRSSDGLLCEPKDRQAETRKDYTESHPLIW